MSALATESPTPAANGSASPGAKASRPQPYPPPNKPSRSNPCVVNAIAPGDSGLHVTFLLNDPQVIKRLQSRAGRKDLGQFLWDELLHKQIVDLVY